MAGRVRRLVGCLIALPTMVTAATVSPAVEDPIAAAKKDYNAIISAPYHQGAPAKSPRESVPPLTIEQERPAALSPMQRARQSENQLKPSILPTTKNWLLDALDDSRRSSNSPGLSPTSRTSEMAAGITSRPGRGASKPLEVGKAATDSNARYESNLSPAERETAPNPFGPFLSRWITKSDFNLLMVERSASEARGSDQVSGSLRDGSIALPGRTGATQLTPLHGLKVPPFGPPRPENPYLAALSLASPAAQQAVDSSLRPTSPGAVFTPAPTPVTIAPKSIEEKRSSAPPETSPQIRQLKRF